jgi:hypothetical protein
MKRFFQSLIFWGVVFMGFPAHAEVIGGINFPRTIGGFELRSVIDNEKSSPGLGVTLFYKAPGVKISFFVYDHSLDNIPEGIDSTIVHDEFDVAISNVQHTYPDAQILVREERLLVGGVSIVQSSFQPESVSPSPALRVSPF